MDGVAVTRALHYIAHLLGPVIADFWRSARIRARTAFEAQDPTRRRPDTGGCHRHCRSVPVRVLRWFARRGLIELQEAPGYASPKVPTQTNSGFSFDAALRGHSVACFLSIAADHWVKSDVSSWSVAVGTLVASAKDRHRPAGAIGAENDDSGNASGFGHAAARVDSLEMPDREKDPAVRGARVPTSVRLGPKAPCRQTATVAATAMMP